MTADQEGRRGKPRGRHPDKRLSVPKVRTAGPGRHADGNGLYLEVDESGARRWLLRTMVHGRRRDIGLGGATYVSLADAREKARHLRGVARTGGDPIAERDREKRRSITFEAAARKVHADQIVPHNRNSKHVSQWLRSLEVYVFPLIGSYPVHAIAQSDILRVLSPIWTEKPETARRIRQRMRTIFDWAHAAGEREGLNPVMGVEKGLPRQRDRTRHFAALPWQELPELMWRLEKVSGMGAIALRFAILTAARSGEVRGVTWEELDLEEKSWRIPAERMKGGLPHRVPLSEAALAVLAMARDIDPDRNSLVFPSMRTSGPLSDMTLSAVLKRLDVSATVHGFRSSFRDWAEEETAFPHEVKEAALAHRLRDKVEAAYRRTDLFDKRRQMMDAWASFLTSWSENGIRLRT